MSFSKPFHRNVRAIKPASNSGYSGWAYIIDRNYARNPEHYVRAFQLIQNDLREIFEYVEPGEETRAAYSYRIHALLMRTCIEIEANFKAILLENTFTIPTSRNINMGDYRKVDVTHHLSSYEVMLPIWNGAPPIIRPFEVWLAARNQSQGRSPSPAWYQAYNASKHDRHDEFKSANLENLISAVAGLLVLLTSQFKTEDFGGGSRSLGVDGYEYHPMEAALGSLFRIKFPDDWTESEIYDFDWSKLQTEQERFEKIDYNLIP